MVIAVEPVTGNEILPWLSSLARLRIQVFRGWPYLYEGDEEYERRYLQKYIGSEHGLVVLAVAGGEVVGASTGLPMIDADPEFRAAFSDSPFAIKDIFYFGESVLRDEYRGQGLGHSFFDEREAFAREHGFRVCTFCAVERPADHPARPPQYRPLDDFWRRRGYEKVPGAISRYRWRDVGAQGETEKSMQFWSRELG